MKKLVLALAASTIAGQALAADIVDYPPPEPPVVYAPAFSWTGAYIGGQAGGSFNGSSSDLPASFVFIPGIPMTPTIPATPGTPGSPGTPATPGNPGSPFIPGTPGTPGSPGTPGTPATFGTVEFSCSAAGAGGAGAGSCAVEYPDGSSAIVPYDELSAAYAQAGNAGALGVAGVARVVTSPGTPGTPATPGTPGTPDTPAVPPTAGTPELPATPGTPGTPEIPGNPGTPDQTYAYDFGANTRAYSEEDDSFAGGAHVGYNYALGSGFGGNAFVVGVVGDLSYVDITKGAGITDGIESIGVTQELDYLATLRLKAGLGVDRFLVYGTGGLAFGNVETTIFNTAFASSTSDDDTRVGYAVGAGTDYALTDNFILGVEYLYTDLGSNDVSQVVDLANGSTLTTKSDDDFDFHTVWAKASFRFN